ncbi:MAG: prolyl oligopeptidase family serine peptidase [Elusimicrobia bacterium]|nr:prolyl oligopeptidase family serine peptidase [Elusimicrobiota bacterium]
MDALSTVAAALAVATSAALEHGGVRREYTLVEPPGLAGPAPVVFALHGGGGRGRNFRTHIDGRLDALAVREKFRVAYPEGVNKAWNDGRDFKGASGADDLGFLAALADTLVREGKADSRRLYLLGVSNGGFMAHALACAQADRWAAIGAVIASLGESVAAKCRPARPVPVLMVNGTEDRLIPWDGRSVRLMGRSRGTKLTVPETASKWAELDGCTGEPERSALVDREDDGTRWSLEARRDCRGGSEVLLYKVDGAGHTWPKGKVYLPRLVGRTSKDVDFEALAWDFFKAHPLPGR